MLNTKQQQIAGLLILSFRMNYNNYERKIKSNEIVNRLRERCYSCNDAELREIIGHIRRNDLCGPGFILSDNTGYWYSEDEKEMERVWNSNHSRALEIMNNFAPLSRRFKHLISEKNSLFNDFEN